MHVVNLTLNLVRGRKLAWQERKAAPFAVTPMHSGSYYLGYRESRDYGGKDGISIGTAVAISGAAVSPNMGYSSSPVIALLLTLFNVRLGWWLGNPGIAGNDTLPLRSRDFRFARCSPKHSADRRSQPVRLSVRRRALRQPGPVRDGAAPLPPDSRQRCGRRPDYEFEDLGNAVRKIRIDLGIPIEFTPMQIRRRKDGALDKDGRYCALGRIRYSAVDGDAAPDGIVVCIKPAIYGTEPQDVLNFAARKKDFPQETTLDQFFGESQFESYRQLGEYETRALCAGECRFDSKNAWARFLVEAARKNLGLGQEHWIDLWLESLAERREITLVGDGAKAA